MSMSNSSSFYRRKKDPSGELDVFEAVRYYSGQNELGLGLNGPPHPCRIRRMSLDEHVRQPPSVFLPQGHGKQTNSNGISNKHRHEHRQPRSPGGRLASFLNSLFNQLNSKKKKSNKYTSSSGSSSSVPQAPGKEHEDPDQNRRRRSSISHFTSSSSAIDPYPVSSTNSIRNLNYHTNYDNNDNASVTTPTKPYKDLRSLSDHKQVEASNKPVSSIGNKAKTGSGIVGGNKSGSESKSSGNKGRGLSMEFSMKFDDNNGSCGGNESKLVDHEDGEESDSSSDLFELQIGGGGYCSSGLPVYETTHIERIKNIGHPID